MLHFKIGFVMLTFTDIFSAWSDALKVVVQIRKPRDLLIKMRSICPIPEYQRTINDLIEKS